MLVILSTGLLLGFHSVFFQNAVMGNMAVAEVGFKDAFREAYVAGYNTKACEARDAD